MLKRHAFFLAMIAVLLTAFSIALSRRDSQDWRANRSRRLFPFPWQDTVSVRLDKPGGSSLRFEKTPRGEWRIALADGLDDLLNYRAVDELAALATLTWREPARDGKAPDPGKATVLTAASAAGQTVTLALGDSANNLRMVTVDGDSDAVYGVNLDLLKFVDWPERRFRNLSLAAAGASAKPRRIVLSPGGADAALQVVLEKTASGWRLTSPVSWPVDETRLDILLRWLERLRAESIEAEMTGDWEWFGFTPEASFLEVEYDLPDAAPVKRRVDFGKRNDAGGVYARVAGRNPVFSVPGDTLSEILLDNAAEHPLLWCNFYRKRTVNFVGEEMPDLVTVEQLLPAPIKLTIRRQRDRDGVRWTGVMEKGEESRSFAIDPPNPAEPMRPLTALLTGLSSIRIKTFLADSQPGPETIKWTAYPAWRFTCADAGGSPHSLVLYAMDAEGALPPGAPFVEGRGGPQAMTRQAGMPENAGIAFTFDQQPAVMEMFGDLAYLLCLPPYRYQARGLVESDPSLWEKVEITSDGATRTFFAKPDDVNEQWWLARDGAPEPLMDDNNQFVAMLLELSRLRTEGFVATADIGQDTSLAEFGLDQPTITAIVYVSRNGDGKSEGSKALFSLTVGDRVEADEGQRYARLNNDGPIFLVSHNFAEALARRYR